MKQYTQFKLWSNIFFLIPLVLVIINHIWWYSIIIGIVFIASIAFHFSDEQKFEYIDIVFSVILMLSNFVLLFLGYWILPYSIFAVICALVALLFYFRQHKNNYNLNHSMWHIFSVGVCIFCLLTFIQSIL